MVRLYLVNAVAAVRGGFTLPNSQAPEHVTIVEGVVSVASMSFGNEGHFLVAVDATPEAHTAINALPRVNALPVDLDTQLTAGAVTTVTNALEARNIPAHWVTTAFTYRQVLRVVVGIFQFAQIYYAQHNLNLFRGGANLDTRVNQIPQVERDRLSSAAQAAGLDTSGITGTTTIRQILRALGEQWLERPFALGGQI